MSRATQVEINVGDNLTITDLNTTMTNVNAATADIDGQNVRDEGIDQRNIAAESVVADRGAPSTITFASDLSSTAANVAATIWTLGGAGLVRIGPLTFDPNDGKELIIRLSFHYYVVLGTANFQLYRSNAGTGGPFSAVAESRRQGSSAFAASPQRGTCTIVHRVTSTASTNIYFALYAWEPGGNNITISSVNFFPERILL